MLVVITRKHIDGISFDQRKPGALVRAFNQQHSEVNMIEECDGFCYDTKRNRYDFSNDDATGYSRTSFKALKEKQINEIKVTLELNNIY